VKSRLLSLLVLAVPLIASVGCGILSPAAKPAPNSGVVPQKSTVTISRVTSVSVTVTPRKVEPVASVEVVPTDIVMLADQLFIFSVRAYDSDKKLLFGDIDYKWQVANSAAGRIDDSGLFRSSKTPGRYKDAIKIDAVQVVDGESIVHTSYASVNIVGNTVAGPMARVEVLPGQITLEAGQPFAFNALSYDALDNPLARVKYTWSVVDTNAGTISSLGFFRAGSTAGTYDGVIKVSASQTVNGSTITKESVASIVLVPSRSGEIGLANVDVLPKQITLSQGDTMDFAAVSYDGSGRVISGVRYVWALADVKAGNLNGSGTFAAEGLPGIYREAIVAEAFQRTSTGERSLGKASATVNIVPPVVKDGFLDRVSVVPQAMIIQPKGQFDFSALAYTSTNIPLTNVTLAWSVTNPSIGTISKDGFFKAGLAPGRYPQAIMVQATQLRDGKTTVREAYISIDIPGPISRIDVNPAAVSLTSGEVIGVSARAYDERGVYIPGVTFRFKMANSKAGTVTVNGIFEAGKEPGDYPDAITVEGQQFYPREIAPP